MHPWPLSAQSMREAQAVLGLGSGTSNAVKASMSPRDESWTIPLQVIMITTLVVGLIMVIAVFLMH